MLIIIPDFEKKSILIGVIKKKNRIPEEAWVTLQHQDFWRKPVSEWKDLSTWDEYFLQNNSGTRTIKASHDSLQAELNVLIQHGDKRTKELKKVLSIQEELKKRKRHPLPQNPPPPQRPASPETSSNELTSYELSFSQMAENKKWKLSSEKIVEDTMFRYGMKLNEESLIHSWILDLEDTRLKKLFTKEEWNEIKACNINKVPKIPEDLAEHMVSYAENDLRALRKKVLRSWINPDDEYDPVKHGDFQYIHTVYERLCTFYERNSSPLERDMLENWYNINIWSIIFDRCFEQLEVVTCIRGESSSIASSERKNKDRNLDKRKEMGRRNDGTIRERNGRCEFGLVEAAKKFEENSTKWLKESFKTPKIMRDMLVQLMSVVKNDDRAKKLRTVGWLHFGLYAQTLEMDCANGYVCRLIRRELHKVGKGLDRDGIADTLALLTAVLQTRYIVAETYNIIKMPEAPDKTLLLRIIDEVGSSLPKSSDKEVPTTARTPKKGR